MVKQVLLDTNFIVSCIKEKVDFFEEIPLMGISIIIPEQVIKELEKLCFESALRLLEKNKFKKIDLPGKNVDNAIINYAKKNPQLIIATLDRGIKRKIRNPVLMLRKKKKLEIF